MLLTLNDVQKSIHVREHMDTTIQSHARPFVTQEQTKKKMD